MVEHYPFKIHSDFEPQGDQPQALRKSWKVLKREKTSNFIRCNSTGKTFTMSNVIKEVGKPTLISRITKH